ncbi:MAG: hypothetical protein WBX25_09715 [Rhodomicrobium sp.]
MLLSRHLTIASATVLGMSLFGVAAYAGMGLQDRTTSAIIKNPAAGALTLVHGGGGGGGGGSGGWGGGAGGSWGGSHSGGGIGGPSHSAAIGSWGSGGWGGGHNGHGLRLARTEPQVRRFMTVAKEKLIQAA